MIIIMRMVLFSFVVEPASSGGGDGNDGNKKKPAKFLLIVYNALKVITALAVHTKNG